MEIEETTKQPYNQTEVMDSQDEYKGRWYTTDVKEQTKGKRDQNQVGTHNSSTYRNETIQNDEQDIDMEQ